MSILSECLSINSSEVARILKNGLNALILNYKPVLKLRYASCATLQYKVRIYINKDKARKQGYPIYVVMLLLTQRSK